MDRLARKFETARTFVPKPVVSNGTGSRVGVIAYGSSDFAVEEARVLSTQGRPDGLPAPAGPSDDRRSAGLRRGPRTRLRRRPEPRRADVRPAAARAPADALKLRSIRHYDGFPLDAETVVEGIEAGEKN